MLGNKMIQILGFAGIIFLVIVTAACSADGNVYIPAPKGAGHYPKSLVKAVIFIFIIGVVGASIIGYIKEAKDNNK